MSQSSFHSEVELPVAAEVVSNFLQDLSHHERLQPQQVQDWTGDESTVHFTIQGLGRFSLNLQKAEQEVRLIASAESPVPLQIRWQVHALQADLTRVELTISAELNMMMKMLASGPIQQLANYQTAQLQEIFT